MAVGLIKNQITRNSSYQSSPLKGLRQATADYRKEMTAYKNMEFKNPYAQNIYSGMENTMEDLTVNQQQAQFQSQQSQQSQANILNSLTSGGQFNAGNVQDYKQWNAKVNNKFKLVQLWCRECNLTGKLQCLVCQCSRLVMRNKLLQQTKLCGVISSVLLVV